MVPGLKGSLELSQQYGLISVAFLLMAFFLGALIIFVLRQNERRENKYFDLVENKLAGLDKIADERHEANQKILSSLFEGHRRSREEHDMMLNNQRSAADQHQKITSFLNELLIKVG